MSTNFLCSTILVIYNHQQPLKEIKTKNIQLQPMMMNSEKSIFPNQNLKTLNYVCIHQTLSTTTTIIMIMLTTCLMICLKESTKRKDWR